MGCPWEKEIVLYPVVHCFCGDCTCGVHHFCRTCEVIHLWFYFLLKLLSFKVKKLTLWLKTKIWKSRPHVYAVPVLLCVCLCVCVCVWWRLSSKLNSNAFAELCQFLFLWNIIMGRKLSEAMREARTLS